MHLLEILRTLELLSTVHLPLQQISSLARHRKWIKKKTKIEKNRKLVSIFETVNDTENMQLVIFQERGVEQNYTLDKFYLILMYAYMQYIFGYVWISPSQYLCLQYKVKLDPYFQYIYHQSIKALIWYFYQKNVCRNCITKPQHNKPRKRNL